MELRKINKEDAKAQWEYTTNLPEDENGLTNPYKGVNSGKRQFTFCQRIAFFVIFLNLFRVLFFQS